MSNSNLISCPDCGKEISKNATACPGCGRAMRSTTVQTKTSPVVWLIGLFILGVLITFIFNSFRQ